MKPLPIGISDFKELLRGGYAYVDKTLLIEEILEKGTKVALIPRPRRFGKTLNLSMLCTFFEKSEEDNGRLFHGLKIWEKEHCRVLQGQFPVIFFSFKDIKFPTWEETLESLRGLVAEEYQRHESLLEDGILAQAEKEDYRKILFKESSTALLSRSLFLLTQWLHRRYKKKVIVLIDEYDTPAHAAYLGNYYDSLIGFLRNWISSGLKDNPYLERGVLTGILRIAKESIFSGANNFSTFTILNSEFQDKFGLTEAEVEALLEDYGLQGKLPEIRQWYDGYRIGFHQHLYNPWSVLNCIVKQGSLIPYWVNTSDNALMKRLIEQGSEDLKADVEELLRGGHIKKNVEEGIIFTDLDKSPNAVWSLLLYCGYLSLAAPPSYGTPCSLRIPNAEVFSLYQSMILDWFERSLQETKYRLLLQSLVEGDVETFSSLFQQFLLSSASVLDIPAEESEKIYHAFILGMLIGLKDRYIVKSNRESGLGRYDVMLIPKNHAALGVIMEFKRIDPFKRTDLETAAASALRQIKEKHYAQELLDHGVKRILYLALAFEGKNVLIRHEFHI